MRVITRKDLMDNETFEMAVKIAVGKGEDPAQFIKKLIRNALEELQDPEVFAKTKAEMENES